MTPQPRPVKIAAARNDRPAMSDLLRTLDDETIGRVISESERAMNDSGFDPDDASQWSEFVDRLAIQTDVGDFRSDVSCKIVYNLYLATRVANEDHYEQSLEREEYRQRWSQRYGSTDRSE